MNKIESEQPGFTLVGGRGFIGEYLEKLLSTRNGCRTSIVDKDSFLSSEQYKKTDILVMLTQPNPQIIKEVISFVHSSKTLNKVVYLSSLLLYSNAFSKQNEDSDVFPKTIYELGKYNEENMLSEATKMSGCTFTIARLGNVYGDVKNKGIINNIFISLFSGKELIISGNPRLKVRDYVFIEDAVNLLESLILYDQKGQKEIYNICSGIGYNLYDVIQKIEQIAKKKIVYKTSTPVSEKYSVIGDNSKIFQISGNTLSYDIDAGLQKTYLNYLKIYG